MFVLLLLHSSLLILTNSDTSRCYGGYFISLLSSSTMVTSTTDIVVNDLHLFRYYPLEMMLCRIHSICILCIYNSYYIWEIFSPAMCGDETSVLYRSHAYSTISFDCIIWCRGQFTYLLCICLYSIISCEYLLHVITDLYKKNFTDYTWLKFLTTWLFNVPVRSLLFWKQMWFCQF